MMKITLMYISMREIALAKKRKCYAGFVNGYNNTWGFVILDRQYKRHARNFT